nr:hypothetical protein [Leptolyngbya sp. 7M]
MDGVDHGAARRPRLPAQQRRRAADAPARAGPEELPVRRLAGGRQARRDHLHPGRHRGAEWLGPAGLSARPARPHRHAADQPHRRTRTLEPTARRRLDASNNPVFWRG